MSIPRMLTLDALARMARKMSTEAEDDGVYRHPDKGLRTRAVTLPPPKEEARRAWGLFGLVVGLSTAALTPVGVLVTHGEELLAAQAPDPGAILRTGLWFLGATLLFIVPFAAIGLVREVRRYRRVHEAIGERATIDTSGRLRSEDGSRTWPL